jgi:hypothetical protein
VHKKNFSLALESSENWENLTVNFLPLVSYRRKLNAPDNWRYPYPINTTVKYERALIVALLLRLVLRTKAS